MIKDMSGVPDVPNYKSHVILHYFVLLKSDLHRSLPATDYLSSNQPGKNLSITRLAQLPVAAATVLLSVTEIYISDPCICSVIKCAPR
jgi:hypothetical protein